MKHSNKRLILAVALAGCGVVAYASNVGAQGIGIDTLEEMLIPTPQKIERGRVIYEDQCAGCHGPEGKGEAEYPTEKFVNPVPDFTQAQYRYGGGPIQIYNAISKGLPAPEAEADVEGEDKKAAPYHPTYGEALRYQQRWAVTHYVRSLGPTDDLTDPPEVVEQARIEAEEGTCDEEVKSTIASRVKPKGEEQLQTGKKLYAQNCQTCHGETGKGDGPAGGALQPPPRDFTNPKAEWTKGTSPLNIFNVLTNGIDGTAMASFASLSEDERWALTHYLRQWIPEEKRQESTEEDILAVCRSLSQPPAPEPITVDRAMSALIDDQPEDRYLRLAKFGPIELSSGASEERGRDIYLDQCARCHGDGLQGRELGPFAVQRAPSPDVENPVLRFEVRGLVRGHAGGNFRDFAERSTGGVHATLPDMSAASLLDKQDWQDLQAYIASVEGKGQLGKLRPGKIGAQESETADSEATEEKMEGDENEPGAPTGDASATTDEADAGTTQGPDASP